MTSKVRNVVIVATGDKNLSREEQFLNTYVQCMAVQQGGKLATIEKKANCLFNPF